MGGKYLSPNGGRNFQGAVPLGGREYRLTLDRGTDHNLRNLAKAVGATPVSLAERLLDQAILDACREYVMYAQVASFMANALIYRAETPTSATP